MIFFYTQRSVLYSVIVRDVSSGSRWEQMQKPKDGYYVKKDLKEWDFIKSHPLSAQGSLWKRRQKE